MRKAQVLAHFGSVLKVCEALGITRQAVEKWPDGDDLIPKGAACELQILTGGVLRVDFEAYARQKVTALRRNKRARGRKAA